MNTEVLPAPLTPADCDLRDFQFMPIDIVRLFNSEFHAKSNDSQWRAGITLWLKSFHQVPSGSIPDDDVALTRLAELGRDVKAWRKVKEVALHGWVKCSDGRLYHPVVVEKALEAWQGKRNQRTRTSKARLQAMLAKLTKSTDMFEFAHLESNVQTLLEELSQSLSQTEFESIKKSVTGSVTEAKGKREGKGKGQGQGIVNSVPDGTGSELPPGLTSQEAIFQVAVPWLVANGAKESSVRSLLGGAVKHIGADDAWKLASDCMREKPIEPLAWLAGGLNDRIEIKKTGGARPSKQEALEAANRAVAERLAGEPA